MNVLSLTHTHRGQNEWVIYREFDRNIKLVSWMVSGGVY